MNKWYNNLSPYVDRFLKVRLALVVGENAADFVELGIIIIGESRHGDESRMRDIVQNDEEERQRGTHV